MEYQLHSK